MNILLLLSALLLSAYTAASAADSTQTATTAGSETVFEIVGNDVLIVGQDAIAYVLAPLSYSGRQWLFTAGAVGGTVAAISVDREAADWIQRQSSPFNDEVAAGTKLYGERLYALAFAMSLYGVGLATGEDDVRVTGRLIGESLLLAGITTQSIKMLAGRSRPFLAQGPWYFDPLQNEDNSRLSLPSGHTTVAFAVSTVLAERIDNVWASVGLYSLASLTALSRVYHNDHWLSDVLLGAMIGTGSGLAVTAFEEAREQRAMQQTVFLVPTANGIALVCRL